MQQIINGLSLGSIYALLALGYTMVYGIIKLINFAHGDIYMLGAFWGYYAINYLHFSFVPALLSAMVMAALSGVLIEYLAYRPLRNSPRIAALITAIGVSFFLENGMSFLFGANARNFPQVITTKTYQILGGRCFKCATAYFVHILGTDGDAAVHYQANNDGQGDAGGGS